MMQFIDRIDAGLQLANKLRQQMSIWQIDPKQLLVLSIPRGGVILGNLVAHILHCPHDILIVKKIGFPGQEELAIGAIAENGVLLLNNRMIKLYDLRSDEIEKAVANARNKVQEYVRSLRRQERMKTIGKTVILVDDGVATGETIKAAIRCLRGDTQRAQKIIVAVPVSSPSTLKELVTLADSVLCLYAPDHFGAVGQWYKHFLPVSDEEVIAILEKETLAAEQKKML